MPPPVGHEVHEVREEAAQVRHQGGNSSGLEENLGAKKAAFYCRHYAEDYDQHPENLHQQLQGLIFVNQKPCMIVVSRYCFIFVSSRDQTLHDFCQ